MFSIFDYLRRRTCDAFLAGAYDAVEILQSENFKLPAPIEQSNASQPSPSNLLAGPKNGAPQKILPLAPSKPVAEQKSAPPAEKKDGQKSVAGPKPASQTPPPPATSVSPTPQSELFAADSRRDEPLPPRRRGRPRKNPPDGNSQ